MKKYTVNGDLPNVALIHNTNNTGIVLDQGRVFENTLKVYILTLFFCHIFANHISQNRCTMLLFDLSIFKNSAPGSMEQIQSYLV